mmetsp:Transcript_22934/g.23878  ORF Transcript_22934/g.23878 Transcript_22934/m.23878 type:complete len:217 (+) Transcript_22934:2-652(+)
MVSVYLYVANIIDYLRLVSLIASLFYFETDPIKFAVLYFCSFSLDLFDGMAARYFKQCSRFGSALDMITDRLSTLCLLAILGRLYSEYFLVFTLLIVLDIGSHWLQIYSSLLQIIINPDIVNHKSIKEKFVILEIYYHNKYVLFTFVLFAELFLIMLYVNFHYPLIMNNDIYKGLYWFSFAVYASKQFVSVVQIMGASDRIVSIDSEKANEQKKNE